MKEIKETILITVPVDVVYDDKSGLREIVVKEITRLHFDMCSSQGYRAKINKRGWEQNG